MPAKVWAVSLERPLTEREEACLLSRLPAERRERLLRVKEPTRRREPLCAYALLELALREEVGLCALPELRRTELGKPFFPGFPAIQFSISHTEGAALVGLSARPVGVDVEKIHPVRPRMMREIADTDAESEFFRVWVRREARAKLRGSGIGAMLRQEPPLSAEERYQELSLFSDCAAGAAFFGGETQARRCSMEELLRAARS